jgi:hypothetical protein
LAGKRPYVAAGGYLYKILAILSHILAELFVVNAKQLQPCITYLYSSQVKMASNVCPTSGNLSAF